MRVVLASASPRRLELLSHLGLDIVVRPADIDESVRAGEDPVAYVRRLSIEKAAAVESSDLTIAADTTVDVDGRILGKPVDGDDARTMLRSLSANTHRVHTGVTVRLGAAAATAVATTLVTFAGLGEADLDWYVATGEPFGKAGAYAIQGAGGAFVQSVEGSVSNVIGLPLTLVLELARSLGVDLLNPD
ncbi:MAG: maf protein [Ilumatobacteraceae bacterium]|nr:maf protein [Ilumatobacteraceae bacterium]